jgi:glycosyltransferase involved in cell wall biosynthesis
MRILLLCEGDAETRNSWSGISKSVVEHLRALGHEVTPCDVDLHGVRRWIAAARTVSWNRSRWWARYHLADLPFRLRSRNARRAVARRTGEFDLILQFGATFRVHDRHGRPLCLYCDSNVALAEMGAASGYSDAAVLTPRELVQIHRREQSVYDDATVIMTLSQLLADTFSERFDIPKTKLSVVGAGPNFESDFHRPQAGDEAKPGPPTVLFVGRQFHRKGGDLLLRAFARVRSRIPQARLVIIGPDEIGEPAGAGVELVGFLRKDHSPDRERLLRAYRSAGVFCLPTRFEPFGVSYLEAMFHSVPCIGPRAWAVPEMIVDGETGILVPTDDEEALSEAICRILSDPELARRMGEAGLKRARERFTWEAVTASMAEAMQNGVSGDVPGSA